MSWNHRVFRIGPDQFGDYWYTVKEIHYDLEGKPVAYTSDDCWPGGETVDGLREEATRFIQACDKPVLEMRDGKLREANS